MFEEIPETPYAMRKRIRFIYEEIGKRIKNTKSKRETRILDIGCGTGELVTIPLGSLGASVLGIDIDAPSIEHAKRENPFENVRFECTSVDKLADQQFDFIICSEVLEHLEDPAEMLNLIQRMLKGDGICIVSIPNGYGPKEMEVRLYNLLSKVNLIGLLKLLKRNLKLKGRLRLRKGGEVKVSNLKDTLSTESPHIQFFSYGRFKSLLKDCNLSVIKMQNRRFLSGPFSDMLLSKSEVLLNWNVKIADKLPYFCVSSWMFIIERSRKKAG